MKAISTIILQVRSRPSVIVVLAVILASTVQANTGVDYASILSRVSAEHLKPRYQAFAGASDRLYESVSSRCVGDVPSTALKDMRTAFHRAMDAWQGVQHIRHGVVLMQGRHQRIQFWPDKRSRSGKHLARLLTTEDTQALFSSPFSENSVAVQGFPALERLLFDEMPLSVTPQGKETLARCGVAIAISQNLAIMGRDLAAHYWATLKQEDPKAGLRDLLTDLSAGLQVTAELKLKAVAGRKKTRLRRAESWRSERSLKNVANNLAALRELVLLLHGTEAPDPQFELIKREFASAEMSVKQLGPSFAPIQDDPNKVAQVKVLAALVFRLRDLTLTKLSKDLGLGVGFNSFDGD